MCGFIADIVSMYPPLQRPHSTDLISRAHLKTSDPRELPRPGSRLVSNERPGHSSLRSNEHLELGQFIPLAYHFNMLADDARMAAFKDAIEHTVSSGQVVLELGGGTGVLSFFAAQTAASVICVERNPELAEQAQKLLQANASGTRVTVVQADAFDYLPPVPVNVVICEMLHAGMLREKQLAVIQSFKTRYLQQYGPPLPSFIPEAFFLAVQPVQHSFEYHGFVAPTPVFQNPQALHPRTRALAAPVLYRSHSYQDAFSQDCSWRGLIAVAEGGHCNALRFITKNILSVLLKQQRAIDWHSQYLVIPLQTPVHVTAGQQLDVSFSYRAGDPIMALQPEVSVIDGA